MEMRISEREREGWKEMSGGRGGVSDLGNSSEKGEGTRGSAEMRTGGVGGRVEVAGGGGGGEGGEGAGGGGGAAGL